MAPFKGDRKSEANAVPARATWHLDLKAGLAAGLVLAAIVGCWLTLATVRLNRIGSPIDGLILWLYLQAPVAVLAFLGGLALGFLWWFVDRSRRGGRGSDRARFERSLALALGAITVVFGLTRARASWWYMDRYPWVDSAGEMTVVAVGSLVLIAVLAVIVGLASFLLLRGARFRILDRPLLLLLWLGAASAGSIFLASVLTGNSGEIPPRPDSLPVRSAEVSGPVAIIGVDGATFRIIDPMLEHGELPNLASLMSRGASGELATLVPCNSPILWTSIATGVRRDSHGVMNFLVQHPKGMRSAIGTFPSHVGLNTAFPLRRLYGSLVETYPVTVASRRAATVWEVAQAYGLRVGVVNWWPSWPAIEVNGFLISNRVREYFSDEGWREGPVETRPGIAETDVGLTWPADLFASLRRRAREEGWRDFGDAELVEITAELWRQEQPDLVMLYLAGPDGVQHHRWDAYEPELFYGVDASYRERYASAIEDSYREFDEQLGELLNVLGSETRVFVLSDHGAGPRFSFGPARGWKAGHEHAPPGIVVAAGPGLKAGVTLTDPSILDIAPTVLSLLGIPPAEDSEGRVLVEMLASPSPRREDAPATWSFLVEPIEVESGGGLSAEEERRLKALGYL